MSKIHCREHPKGKDNKKKKRKQQKHRQIKKKNCYLYITGFFYINKYMQESQAL